MKGGWTKNDEGWWRMNEEWWRMDEEWWMMNFEGWWFQAVKRFWQTDKQTILAMVLKLEIWKQAEKLKSHKMKEGWLLQGVLSESGNIRSRTPIKSTYMRQKWFFTSKIRFRVQKI